MDNIFSSLNDFSQGFSRAIQEELDFDFSINEQRIESLADFDKLLRAPSEQQKNRIFYRGERMNSSARPLIPTMFRKRERLLGDNPVVNINADYLLNYYKGMGDYYSFFNSAFGTASKHRLYELCAFSQHYIDSSPFIDFTKSLFVALSFALKGRREFDEDIVIYTAEINDADNYTNDMVVAECWLQEYKVSLFNSPEAIFKAPARAITPQEIREFRETLEASARNASPKARLIDIPTNDLMRQQQGVFLLLTDFRLVQKNYLTKNIRENFYFTKNIISRDICPQLLEMISKEAPWYEYDCLLDVSRAARRAASSADEKRD